MIASNRRADNPGQGREKVKNARNKRVNSFKHALLCVRALKGEQHDRPIPASRFYH